MKNKSETDFDLSYFYRYLDSAFYHSRLFVAGDNSST